MNNSFLNIILYTLLLISLSLSLESSIQFQPLNENSTDPVLVSKSFSDISETQYISYSFETNNTLKDSIFHFWTHSTNSKISTQLIFSTTLEKPTIENADQYSWKYYGDTHLYFNASKISNKMFLTIKCNKYPCSFDLNTKQEKSNGLLELGEDYSYYIVEGKNNIMRFKINLLNNKNAVNIITVSTPADLDASELNYTDKNEEKTINENYRTPFGKIYVIQEDKYENVEFLVLNIESIENQYITISTRTILKSDSENYISTKILPNNGVYYSYLNSSNFLNEECFSVNQSLTNNDTKNSAIVFATVEYFSNPIKYYFKNTPDKKITPSKSSINIILNKDTTTKLYPEICFILDENNKAASFQIEITDQNDIVDNPNINNPLLSGYIHTKILNKNSLTFYTHYSDIHFIKEMSYAIKVLKGDIEMFVVHCETYPNCQYSYNDLKNNIDGKNIVKPHIINDMYSYSYYSDKGKDLSPYGSKQNLLFVYCNSNTDEYCQYEVSIFSNYDQVVLFPNQKYHQYMLKDEVDYYKVNIPKNYDKFTKIQIILYTFTGDAMFESVAEDLENITIKNEFIGGKEIYEYVPNGTYPINVKDLNILFNIKAVTNTYYNVEYKIIKENYLTELNDKIFYSEDYTFIDSDITYKDSFIFNPNTINNKKYFAFSNNKKNENKNYVIQIFSQNCEINVNRQESGVSLNNTNDLYQDIIQTNDSIYSKEYYIYEVTINNYDTVASIINNLPQCILYLSGGPVESDNNLILTENDQHYILFQGITKTKYLFPYLGGKNDESFMLIHIIFEEKMSVNISIYFDDNKNAIKKETLGKSGNILLPNKLIRENCKDIEEICNVFIEINLEKYFSIITTPFVKISVSTNNLIPSYIKNGEMRIDSVIISSPLQYFYTDILQNTCGQIILNTKRGEGVLYTRIYKKGTIDEDANWQNILIPNKYSNNLKYDYFTHSVNFDKNDTKNCDGQGCLLLITYENTYTPSTNENYLTEFSISTRLFNENLEKQSILNIPLNTYAYGNIINNKLHYNYFQVYLLEESDQVDFELQCETCILYINKGKNNLTTNNNYLYKFQSKGKYSVFSIHKKNREKIKGTFLTLMIESPTMESYYFTKYALRVLQPLTSSIVNYNIIPIDSDQSANCILSQKLNEGICYFILYIDENINNINDILAHVFTDIDTPDIEINANLISKNIVHSTDTSKIIKFLPDSPKNAKYSTEKNKNFYSDQLIINKNDLTSDEYIIFGVTSAKTTTVAFLATYYNCKNNVIPNSNTMQLMKMNSNSNTNLLLYSSNLFTASIYSVYGIGKINWVDKFNKKQEYEFRSTHELFTFNIFNEFTNVTIETKENFAFYLWQDIKDDKFNIHEIDFASIEKIIFTDIDFPLKIYSLLPFEPIDDKNNSYKFEDLLFNFIIDKINITNNNSLFENSFEIKVALINFKTLKSIKTSKNDNMVKFNNNIKAKYDIGTKTFILNLNKTYLEELWTSFEDKDGLPYIYFAINKHSSNKNIYNYLSGQLLLSFNNYTDYIIPNNHFINDQLLMFSNKLFNLYHLQLAGDYNKNKVIIDFSSNVELGKELTISFIDYENKNETNSDILQKNSSNIEIDKEKSKIYGNMHHIEFKILNNSVKDLLLCIYKNIPTKDKDKSVKIINYIFKYDTYKPEFETIKYNFDNELNIVNKSSNIKLSMKNVEKKQGDITEYLQGDISIRKIEKKDKIFNEQIDTVSILESEYTLLKGEIKFDKENIEINIPNESKENQTFYLSVILNLPDENQKFAYKFIDLSIQGNPDKPISKINHKLLLIIIISVGSLIVILLIVILVICIRKKKNREIQDAVMKTSFKKSSKSGDRENNVNESNLLISNEEGETSVLD